MPQVLNRKTSGLPPGAVYVGRPTKWGNPFSHIKHGTLADCVVDTRDEAVERYREWLLAQPELMKQARQELAGKDLVCWCFPCRCHAQVLIEVANSPDFAYLDEPCPAAPALDPTPVPPVFTGRFRRRLNI